MSGSDMWTEKDKQTRFFFSFSVKKMRNLEKVLDDFVKKRYIDYHFLYRHGSVAVRSNKNINKYLGLFNFL